MDPKQPRILRREWKRYKPHLPKYDSVPVLQLTPLDRPLFACQRCGFSNTYIPICLWCTWASDESTRVFEQSTPRGRRVSAPMRVFWAPAIRHEEIEANDRNQVLELLGDTYYVFVATATSRVAKAKAKSQSKSLGDNNLKAPARARRCHKPSQSMDRPMKIPPSISSPLIADITRSTHDSPISPIRRIRRKKQMSLLRRKSSRSLRTNVLSSECPVAVPIQSHMDGTATQPTVPCPSPSFRLGHPMRPYYSAIRKNMSLPSSPCDYNYTVGPSASGSPAFSIPRMSMTFMEPDDLDLPSLGSLSGRDTSQFSPPTSGCSLSGETELRMALAQQPGNSDEPSSEYKFLKPERRHLKRGVRGKVRQLSKDIKDFVLGAGPRSQL